MLRELLRKLGRERIIYDREAVKPYMYRYYLLLVYSLCQRVTPPA
jgi:hypothetical protein